MNKTIDIHIATHPIRAAWRQIGQREGRLICVPYPSVHQWMALDMLGDVCSLLLCLEVRQDMEMDHFQVAVSTQALYCPARWNQIRLRTWQFYLDKGHFQCERKWLAIALSPKRFELSRSAWSISLMTMPTWLRLGYFRVKRLSDMFELLHSQQCHCHGMLSSLHASRFSLPPWFFKNISETVLIRGYSPTEELGEVVTPDRVKPIRYTVGKDWWNLSSGLINSTHLWAKLT